MESTVKSRWGACRFSQSLKSFVTKRCLDFDFGFQRLKYDHSMRFFGKGWYCFWVLNKLRDKRMGKDAKTNRIMFSTHHLCRYNLVVQITLVSKQPSSVLEFCHNGRHKMSTSVFVDFDYTLTVMSLNGFLFTLFLCI